MARQKKTSTTPSILELGGLEEKLPLRQINELNTSFTVDKGMKVINSYIADKGDYASELNDLVKHLSQFNIRQLYVPLSLYGVNCDGKYILPVLTEVAKNALANAKDFKNTPPVETLKKEKVEKEIIDGAKASFEGLVDEILMGNEVTQVQINSVIAAQDNKNLISYVDDRLNDLEVEYESFNEYFDNLPKRKYNKIVKLGNDIIDTAKKIKDQAKKAAPKRKVKPQNALKAAEKFKYNPETVAISSKLTIKSLHPVKLQGAKYALIYDVDQRKLLKLISVHGTEFTIKGTTVHNIDFDRSERKAVRSPDKTFLIPKLPTDKKSGDSLFEGINSKALKVTTGRSNENMIILLAN